MDKDRILYKGDIGKFKVTIAHADFDQQRDDYRVQLCWGMMGDTMTIYKWDIRTDESGDAYLIFDSSDMVGVVKAYCIYDVPDTDFESGVRQEVNIQNLCLVTTNPNPQCCCRFESGGDGHVKYERVYRGDVNTLFLNLRTKDQEPILDSEGKQIRVPKAPEDLI